MGLLLRQGANIEAANEEGMTPLLVAASQGRVRELQMLLERGANVEAVNEEGRTPLLVAASQGYVKVLSDAARARSQRRSCRR